MFTGITIIVAVMILWFVAARLYQVRHVSQRRHVELLALSSFMAGFGILCYGLRTLFIDIGQADYVLYRLGITVHLGLGFIPAAIFVFENYLGGAVWRRRVFEIVVAGGALLFTYGTIVPPLNRIVKTAPFEPFPFRLTNYPWQDPFWNKVFIWFCIIVSLCVIWSVLLHSYRANRALGAAARTAHRCLTGWLLLLSTAAFIMPFAAVQPWFKVWQYVFFASYLLISFVIMFLTHDFISRRRAVAYDLYFALGIAYLLFPAMLCIFITPVFARILYLFGAVYLFYGAKSMLTSAGESPIVVSGGGLA